MHWSSVVNGLIAQVVNTSGLAVFEQVVWLQTKCYSSPEGTYIHTQGYFDFRLSVIPHQRARTHTHTQGWYNFRLSVTPYQRARTHTHTHTQGWYDFRLSVTPHKRARTHTHKGVHTHHKVLSISMVTSHH